jgi:endonuclease/exonuclease/phosphatase family metal-dependent hydrolase
MEYSMSYDATLSDTTTLYEGGWDRTLFNLSSLMVEPFCFAYGLLRYRLVQTLDPSKFDNYDSKIKEVAFRLLIASGAIGALYFLSCAPLARVSCLASYGLATKVVRACGYYFQKGGYTYIRGSGAEKEINGKTMPVTWNVAGIGGDMGKDHAGVVRWRLRVAAIGDEIIRLSPDILVLQEIYDTAFGEALIQYLEERGHGFAHYFTHLGKNIWGSESGEIVFTNHPVDSFSCHSFFNNDWTLNRVVAFLELKRTGSDRNPCLRVLGTHFIHNSRPKRKEQVEQILTLLARKSLRSLPTLLMGDLNIERDGPEGAEVLTPYFKHSYPYATPTCTNALVQQWREDPLHENDEMIDYISSVRTDEARGLKVRESIQFEDPYLGNAYDASTMDTRTAKSDHRPLGVTVKGI